MKSPYLDRLLFRAAQRAFVLVRVSPDFPQCDSAAVAICKAIADEDEADLLHEAADELHRLGDRIDVAVSRARGK